VLVFGVVVDEFAVAAAVLAFDPIGEAEFPAIAEKSELEDLESDEYVDDYFEEGEELLAELEGVGGVGKEGVVEGVREDLG
jgi:hypothetical protein